MPNLTGTWILLVENDVQTVITAQISGNVSVSSFTGNDKLRLTNTIAMVCEEIRGAIRSAGKVPVSGTAAAIPPEARLHAARLVVDSLIGAVPQLGAYTESKYWERVIGTTNEWLKWVREGGNVLWPTNPELGGFPNPVQWGDVTGDAQEPNTLLNVAVSTSGGGTGYVVNDILTLAGGTTSLAATVKVMSVSSTGAVTSVAVLVAGYYSINPSTTQNAATGGSGSGVKLDLKMSYGSVVDQDFSVNY